MILDHPAECRPCRKTWNLSNVHFASEAEINYFLNEEGTRYGVYEGIRETYDGPLSMATDMMVWNVTKDQIIERMAAPTDEAWSVPGTARQPPIERGLPDPMSDFIKSGKWREGYEASDKMLDEHAEKYGLEEQDWRKGCWDK